MADTHEIHLDQQPAFLEEQLRVLVDHIPALVWSKLPDGSLDFFNQRFREYTGLSPEDRLGWGWIKVFYPDDRAIDEWRAALAAGKPFQLEARICAGRSRSSQKSERLGEVGGRIVTKVIFELLRKDPTSLFLSEPNWRSELADAEGNFDSNLLRFAGVRRAAWMSI